MSDTVKATLTILDRALWVVDHARVTALPHVDDNGAIIPPDHDRAEPVVDVLQTAIRPSNRGVQKIGITVRLWLALLIVAAQKGQMTIAHMHAIATGQLPREQQWQLGILTKDHNGKARMLTAKQLYDMAEKINKYLDTDPALELSEPDATRREQLVFAICRALLHATHVLPRTGSSYAVDESGVWSWSKGPRKPAGLPLSDPSDEDALTKNDQDRTTVLDESPDPEEWSSTVEPDEDAPEEARAKIARPDTAHADAAAAATATAVPRTGRRAPRVCWFASWGVKTHKSGKRSSYFGYALHALIRVPDVVKGDGKQPRTDVHGEPRLIEDFALTPASTDVVDVTLGLVKNTIARGHRVRDLLGDRHYSYKQFDRWAHKLWRLGVRPVLDLRQNDLGAVDFDGAVILAGTPHCGVPEGLQRLERPAKGARKPEVERFAEQIKERQQYAMYRNKSAWGTTGGDGKTRWRCPARNGTVGCPRMAGSVEIAIANGLPIVTPPEGELPWCTRDTATIPPGPHMKHQQEEYWGSPAWLNSWNRRTYIEGAFGRMKNHHTGNIRRGFICLTGRALVTIAVTAATVAYNLRELEDWHDRATTHETNTPGAAHNPLLDLYRAHPLHERTEHIHGFTMLTERTRAELDTRYAVAVVAAGPDSDSARLDIAEAA